MQYGEIVELGPHRLMCGDAALRDDVFKLIGNDHVNLVLTDPPYGTGIQDKQGRIGCQTKQYPLCIGDKSTTFAREHYQIARTTTNRLIIWGGQCFTDFLPPASGWIIWDKMKPEGLQFSGVELAWSNIKTMVQKYSIYWNGGSFDGDRELNAKVHPMQKSVELFMKILRDYSDEGDVILDCFGGSGTTLIACEMTGRKCLMMEISPEYCDIIVNRYNKLLEHKQGELFKSTS